MKALCISQGACQYCQTMVDDVPRKHLMIFMYKITISRNATGDSFSYWDRSAPVCRSCGMRAIFKGGRPLIKRLALENQARLYKRWESWSPSWQDWQDCPQKWHQRW